MGVSAKSIAAIDPDVTLPQYRALVILASHGDMNVGALGDALAIHRSTATRLCDRLAVKGLITRATFPDRKREVFVRLTSQGRSVVNTVTRRRRNELTRIVKRIDAADRAGVVRAFDVFAEAAGETPEGQWPMV